MDSITKYWGGLADAKGINLEARTIRFVISADTVDRDGEVITPAAIAAAIPGFEKNPVCLAGHAHKLQDGSSPVVGHWLTKTFRQVEGRSEMDLKFASTARGEEYWQLYSEGHQRAVSVGFAPKKYDRQKSPPTITELELYEISCVPVPSNREALAGKEHDELLGELKALKKELQELGEKFEEIKLLAIPERDDLAQAFLGGAGGTERPADKDAETEFLKELAGA